MITKEKIRDYLFLLLVIFLFILGISLCVAIDSNINKAKEIERLSSNQDTLNEEIGGYLSRSGDYVKTVKQLTYSIEEMKKFRKEDMKVIKDLGLKLKQVESLVKLGLETKIHDTIPIRDTVILGDTVKCFKKFDEYIKLIGCINNDSVNLDITHNDTIINVAHWTYKKWFIFKFRTDTIRLESTNKSPYSRIIWNEYIKVIKK